MIKILFFIDKFAYNGSIGGAEKVLITLVNHMDPSKFDITVQTLFPDEYANLLNPNIKYKYCYPQKTSLAYSIFRVEAQLGLVYALHIKDSYDIEVAYLESETTKVMSASTNKQAKKIAWVHCDFAVAVKDKDAFIKKAAKQYKKFDKIVCVSEKCRESFVAMFGNDPEVVVVHNVIDDTEILEKANEQLPNNVEKSTFTLCSVGNFTSPKNYIRLLKTAYLLHEDGYIFDLWIVGDGQQRNMIESFIREHQMESYVTLFGFQKNPYPYMKAADLLVCSSDYEGFSTFVSEGLILGKTILTTDCSGMHELLDHYNNGYITENNDEAFYKGIKRLLDVFPETIGNNVEFSTKQLTKANEDFFYGLMF